MVYIRNTHTHTYIYRENLPTELKESRKKIIERKGKKRKKHLDCFKYFMLM